MVLRDDNFATLRDAIAEGRGIFDNIRKFITFLLSANAGEILIVFAGVLAGSIFFPEFFSGPAKLLILTPAMLLWINIVTDGLPALALGADPKVTGIMRRPPRPSSEPVIDRPAMTAIAGIGVGMAVAGLPLFSYTLRSTGDAALAQTLLFTALVLAEMVALQVIRSMYGQTILSNRWLAAAVLSSLALQAAALYTPLSAAFGVVAIGADHFPQVGAALLAFAFIGIAIGFFTKRLPRRPRRGARTRF